MRRSDWFVYRRSIAQLVEHLAKDSRGMDTNPGLVRHYSLIPFHLVPGPIPGTDSLTPPMGKDLGVLWGRRSFREVEMCRQVFIPAPDTKYLIRYGTWLQIQGARFKKMSGASFFKNRLDKCTSSFSLHFNRFSNSYVTNKIVLYLCPENCWIVQGIIILSSLKQFIVLKEIALFFSWNYFITFPCNYSAYQLPRVWNEKASW